MVGVQQISRIVEVVEQTLQVSLAAGTAAEEADITSLLEAPGPPCPRDPRHKPIDRIRWSIADSHAPRATSRASEPCGGCGWMAGQHGAPAVQGGAAPPGPAQDPAEPPGGDHPTGDGVPGGVHLLQD
jgi:hypothetical protein